MSPAARRILKRLALAIGGAVVALAVVAGVVVWRAGRTPQWYAQARGIRQDDAAADTAFNDRLVPLQNWAARTSAGDLDAKPTDAKQGTLTLTEMQINALLAKTRDSVPGPLGSPRVRLANGLIDLAADATGWGRTVSVSIAVDRTDSGPTLRLAGVRVGDQPVPSGLLAGEAATPLRAALVEDGRRAKAAKIDTHDLTNARSAGAYYARVLLDALQGRAVSPLAFLPGSPQGDALVATKITRLDVTDGSMTVDFRMLEPAERAAAVADLDKPLP